VESAPEGLFYGRRDGNPRLHIPGAWELTDEKGNVTVVGALYGVTVAIGIGLCAYACTTALWHVLPNNGGYADATFEGTVWLTSLASALFVPTKMVAIGKRMSELQKISSMMAD
jgi:hypothetical protein